MFAARPFHTTGGSLVPWRALGFAIALSVGGVLALTPGGTVRAGCGDYLVLSASNVRAILAANGMKQRCDQDAFLATARSRKPVEAPCHGPHCESRRSTVPPPATPSIRLSFGDWLIPLVDWNAAPNPTSSLAALSRDSSPRSGFPGRVERPPRG